MAHEFDHLLDASGGRSFINDRRRRQYTESATRLIAERGVEGASFAAIAEDTDSSKGTIAYHFDSRNQLLLGVVRAIYLSAGESMTDVLHPQVPGAAIQNYIRTTLEWIASHRVEVAALVALRTSSVEEVRSFCNEVDRAVHEQLAELIRTTRPARAGDHDPALISLALRGAIDAYSLALIRTPDLAAHDYFATLTSLFTPDARA